MFQSVLVGFIVIDILMSGGTAGAVGIAFHLDRRDVWITFFSCIPLFGIFAVSRIIESLSISANIDNARQRHYDFLLEQKRLDKVTFDEPEVSVSDRISTLYINTGNSTTRIVGPTKGKWTEWAGIIKDANYRCTARVMKDEYEAFRAAVENTRYAENKNGLQLTDDGRRMIDKLHSPTGINT